MGPHANSLNFTHSIRVDWLLPGIPPSGKPVEVPFVAIVRFEDENNFEASSTRMSRPSVSCLCTSSPGRYARPNKETDAALGAFVFGNANGSFRWPSQSKPIFHLQAADTFELVGVGGHDRGTSRISVGSDQHVVAADRPSGGFQV
jgi:hypothetical protein